MAALNFPANPTNGQSYTFAGRTWIYSTDEGAWQSTSNLGGVLSVAGKTGDVTLAAGDIPELTMDKLPTAAYKRSVRAATTANITLSGTQTIDGVAVLAGNRVLVKNQTAAAENGIYVAAAGAWSRSSDADSIGELDAALVNVDEGTTNGGRLFTNVLKTTDTLGTTAMPWYEVVFNNGTWSISISGSAATLTTGRTIGMTGDVSWTSASFNGSANVTGTATLANSGVTAGTYNDSATQVRPFTVDGKGRITAIGTAVTIAPAFSSITSKPTTLAGYGITDAQALDADLTAIAALTGTSGFLKKTAADTWSLDTNTYLTGNQSITFTGDATGSGATTVALTLANSGVGAGTYRSVTVDAKGRVTAGTNPTTISGYGITDAYTKTEVDSFVQGLDVKAAVRAATTGPITLSGTQTIDGVAVVANDRVLVKDQATASTNGIYIVAAGAWTRATDFDAWAEIPGSFFFVEEGTVNGDNGWVCTSNSGGTLNTTAITFSQFSGAGQITAGTGLSKSGNTLAIANTTVSAASYGSASSVATFTVNAQGQLTAAGSTAIAIASGAVSGLAASATTDTTNAANISSGTLPAGRLPAFTGDATSTAGTSALTLATVATAGTYRSVTVNAKGLVTAGTNPTTLSGYGITDGLSNSTTSTQNGYFGDIFLYDDSTPSHYLQITNSANLTLARVLNLNVNDADRTISLSGNLTVSAAATVSGTNTGDQTITLTGDVTGTGTGSFATTLANSGATAGTYTKVTVDVKGRVTSGTTLVAGDIPALSYLSSSGGTITGALTESSVTDQGLTLNATDNSWKYIGFSHSGTRKAYFGLDSSGNPTWGTDSGGFSVVGASVFTIAGNQALTAGNYNSYSPTLTGTGASGTWGIRITGFANQGSQRLYSTDATYNYDSANPYFGYLTYDGTRWLFQVSPGTPAAVRVAYADASGSAGSVAWSGITSKPTTLSGYGITDALPIGGGTLTGTLYFTDTTNGIYKSGGRLTVRSESTDDVANFASYGLYLPKTGQAASLYVESPIEARAGLRLGSGAASGTITVGATTAATADRLVQRDGSGNIAAVAGNFSGAVTISGGSVIAVQNSQDGGTGRGIYMWNTGDTNWAIYMAQSGAGKAISGGSAPAGLDGRTEHAIRFRAASSTTQPGFIWENSANSALMQLQPNTGNLLVRGGIQDLNSSRFLSPAGAVYQTSSSSITGAWKIALPVGRFKSNTMLRFTVKIYQYSTGWCHTFEIGGYNYNDAAATWYNVSAYATTDAGSTFTVRWGHDGTRQCVWIGETNSSWTYPQVTVTDLQTGYSGYDSDWSSGWSITPVTSFDTVSQTRTASLALNTYNYNSYAPTLTGTGASGTWNITATTATNLGSYYTANDWLRAVGDLYQFKIYGGSRTLIFRTDGTTNDHGGGAYTAIWYQSGSTDANRRMILNTDGTLWTSNYGWLQDYFMPKSGGTFTGTIFVGTSGSGSATRALRVAPSGSSPASFGSYTGSWRSAIEIWDNAATRMLFLAPPDGTNYGYSILKSVGGGFKFDVGSGGGTNALTIEDGGSISTAGNFTVGSEAYSYSWWRSYNATGWYNQTYGGGIWMEDSTWVKVYGTKSFYGTSNIVAVGDVTAYYSDERLKTKTGIIEGAIEKVKRLCGFLYVENDLARELGYSNTRQQVGVSAQQVQAVMPEAVTLAPFDMKTEEFTGIITSKSGENYLTVKYERLVPLLIEAIKEQQAKIEELEARIDLLTA